MRTNPDQLGLFSSASLNPTYEIKRRLRLALADSGLSRDEIADAMNGVAAREGMRRSVSRATLDSWTKDSDPERLPGPAWLTIFCKVTGNTGAIEAMLKPLDCALVGERERQVLTWARAEMEKKRATRKARVALEAIADEI